MHKKDLRISNPHPGEVNNRGGMISERNHTPQLSILQDFSLLVLSQIQQLMNQSRPQNFKKKSSAESRYRKYDYKKRIKLTQMVQKEKKSLSSAARLLGIAQTTARLIMKTWIEEGRVFEKKSERAKRERREAVKQSQARKKENQRARRQARRRSAANRPVPQPAQPASEVKIEENQPEVVQEQRLEVIPQLPLDPILLYIAWLYQQGYLLVCLPTYFC